MVGAGQLARMTHQAAIALGVRLRVLATSHDESRRPRRCAGAVGSPDDLDDLRALAAGADVVTFDHEGVAPEHLATLVADGRPAAPLRRGQAARPGQARGAHDPRALGFPVPPFAHATTPDEVRRFAGEHGPRLVAKAPRGGYDGRGVFVLDTPTAPTSCSRRCPAGCCSSRAWRSSASSRCSSRGPRAARPSSTPSRDRQARRCAARCSSARRPWPRACAALARARAEAIGATGLLAVELFQTPDALLVNEVALRPHNSGHYTIEGCATSQFEQHLRAVLGWPLGLATQLAPRWRPSTSSGPPTAATRPRGCAGRSPCPARTSTSTARRRRRAASSAT
jgi:5-(carboxyamino)imidazole ribonucleotide synthase